MHPDIHMAALPFCHYIIFCHDAKVIIRPPDSGGSVEAQSFASRTPHTISDYLQINLVFLGKEYSTLYMQMPSQVWVKSAINHQVFRQVAIEDVVYIWAIFRQSGAA